MYSTCVKPQSSRGKIIGKQPLPRKVSSSLIESTPIINHRTTSKRQIIKHRNLEKVKTVVEAMPAEDNQVIIFLSTLLI